MPKPSFAEIQGILHADQTRIGALPPVHIAILRNVVVESIEPYVRYLAYRAGLDARVRFGEYDNVFQEAVAGRADLLSSTTDCVVVFLRLEHLSLDLARRFAVLPTEQVAAEVARVQDFVARVIAGIRAQTHAAILWVGFETPARPALGIADSQGNGGQGECIAGLNRFTRERLGSHPSAYFVDLDGCVARVGAGRFYDSRYWHLAKAPYSRAGLEELAGELVRFVRPLKGKNKKCLVLDCDNVLWGGVVGEEGPSGIKLGSTHPGSAFVEFQQELVNLHARGVILALASKNNEEDVWEVFARNPAMVLRREHIAAARINWRDKATNLKDLAAELNIGLDSFVFMDDSPFEIGQVESQLPEVEAVALPADRPAEYRDLLLEGGWFDTLTIQAEDRERGAMYRAEAARRELRHESADLTEYYRSLEMVLTVRFAEPGTIARVAQLTQKTNQFNLTTRRYSDAEIAALADSDSADVVTVQLRDRFGDAGLTGVCIIRYQADRAHIDSLLLSCRVLGRGVEDAFLVQCLKRVRARGCPMVTAEYRPTRKSVMVRDFYPERGFALTTETETERRFELALGQFDAKEPDFFARIESELSDGRPIEA